MSDLNPTAFPVAPSAHHSDPPAAALMRILKTAPQDLWLETIRRTRGAEHNDLVHWMLGQTECDFAVALHAFYRSNPAHHLDHAKPLPLRPDTSQIFAQVLLNWEKGYYRAHQLQVEIVDAPTRTIRRIKQKLLARPRGSLPFSIPDRFLEPDGGEALSLPDYLSPDNAAHLWPLYDALGLQVQSTAPGLSRRVARAKGILNKVAFRTRRS